MLQMVQQRGCCDVPNFNSEHAVRCLMLKTCDVLPFMVFDAVPK